jgi:uncharacterized phage infection (PIP) family protein YhgE
MRDGSTFWLTAVDEWEKALYWRDVADQAIAIPPEGVNVLNSKISAYQFRIDQLKIGYEQAKEQVRQFYEQVDPEIAAAEAKEKAQLDALGDETEAADSQV